MISQWCEATAQQYLLRYAAEGEDVAMLLYSTRLLGQDPSLVLHGGGNTSAKTAGFDELGRPLATDSR